MSTTQQGSTHAELAGLIEEARGSVEWAHTRTDSLEREDALDLALMDVTQALNVALALLGRDDLKVRHI